jgi:hypothetical protein
MGEIYISVDVETDGPIPGPNSMLSIGAAAFFEDRRMRGSFSANLETLEGATADPSTAEWWVSQPEAWEACRKDLQDVSHAMVRFNVWVREMCLPETGDDMLKPVFVGYPAGFDFLFVYWYLVKFTGTSPFSFSALDTKSYAMAIMGCGYRDVSKKTMKQFKEPGFKHTHLAIDDAIEQGYLFLNLLKARKEAF